MKKTHLKTLNKITNGGDAAIYDIHHITDGNQNAIVVEKAVITSNIMDNLGFKATGAIDGKIIWYQQCSFTIETLREIANLVKNL